jgi:hypothetical protein
MAMLTPAQKPRGLASRILFIKGLNLQHRINRNGSGFKLTTGTIKPAANHPDFSWSRKVTGDWIGTQSKGIIKGQAY